MRKIAAEVIARNGTGEKGRHGWITAKGESLERTMKTIRGLATGTLNQAKLTVLGGTPERSRARVIAGSNSTASCSALCRS